MLSSARFVYKFPRLVNSRFASRCFSAHPTLAEPHVPRKTALVLGSSGALGSIVSKHLSIGLKMNVIGADLMELPSDLTLDWELDGFIALDNAADLTDLTVHLTRGVNMFLQANDNKSPLAAIVCASGGWKGDPDVTPEKLQSERDLETYAAEYMNTIVQMREKNLDPVIAAGFVAQHFMAPSGLFVVMGATAALQPTPGMLGYGLSKCAAHHLVQTMGATTGYSLETKTVKRAGKNARRHLQALDDMSVVGILPTMIDTAANRKANPKGDFDQWIQPINIAAEIGKWIETPALRPHSGSLVKVHPSQEGQGAVFHLVR